jgi:hypothetical protein
MLISWLTMLTMLMMLTVLMLGSRCRGRDVRLWRYRRTRTVARLPRRGASISGVSPDNRCIGIRARRQEV